MRCSAVRSRLLSHGVVLAGGAAAALVLTLATGCARPPAPVTPARASASTAPPARVADADDQAEVPAADPAPAELPEPQDGPLFSPEAVHEARIAIAREELVEWNTAKLEVEAQEERDRDQAERSLPGKGRRRARGAHR